MPPCDVCFNLRPETLLTAPEGQRALLFIELERILASISKLSPCDECRLLWNAMSLFKSDWAGAKLENSVELVIAFGTPLRLNWHDDSIQLELFSGYKDDVRRAVDPVPDVFGLANHVSDNSGAEKCFHLATSWLKDCAQSHSLCSPRDVSPLPTRLLHVGTATTNTDPVLVETVGKKGRYVALSYCWGLEQHQILKTTAANLHEHKKGISFNALSRTLQDAITITRHLGIEYLWIDALCIIQGDPEDWAKESSRTSHTYLNAFVTISADNSPGCNKGIFNRQIYGTADQKIPYKDGRLVSVRKAFAQEHDKHALGMRAVVDPEPITCRAWTLQEALLSNRILRYTSNELVWTCNETWLCECGSASGISKDDEYDERYLRVEEAFSMLPVDRVHEQWEHIVMRFSERSATEESDKLPALSGIAAQFAHILAQASPAKTKETYLAGMWYSNLVKYLLWAVEDDFWRSSRVVPLTYQRARQWRAPSWSWASVDGSVIYKPISGLRPCIEILEATTTPCTLDQYGQVDSGKLVVKGQIVHNLPLEILDPEPGRSFTGFTNNKRYAVNVGGQSRTFTPDDPQDFKNSNVEPMGTTLTCLLIGHVMGRGLLIEREEVFLVLRPTAAGENNNESLGRMWKRVGVSLRASQDRKAMPAKQHATDELTHFIVVRLFDNAAEEVLTIL